MLGGDGADTIEGFLKPNHRWCWQRFHHHYGTGTTAGSLSTLNGGAGTDTIFIGTESANNSGTLIGAPIVYNDTIVLNTKAVTCQYRGELAGWCPRFTTQVQTLVLNLQLVLEASPFGKMVPTPSSLSTLLPLMHRPTTP